MRQLTTEDLFKMSRIWAAMDLRLDPRGKSQDQFGAELIFAIVGRLHMAREEMLDWLADLNDMSVEDVATLELPKLLSMLKEVFSIPGVLDFFKQAGRLTK